MSTIKSFSVGNGDMFYIYHNSDNFTIIDCCYEDEEQRDELFERIRKLASNKGITRFITTHPDEDHIRGLDVLDDKIGIVNFYVVKNKAIKNDDETDSFKRYCKLRDGEHAFYVYKGCSRKWMNQDSDKNDKDQRESSGINYLWPDTDDKDFKDALDEVKEGSGFNNISPILTYSVKDNVRMMWMGDMETTFLDKIKDKVKWSKVDILFAPHHGRKSGHVSSDVLEKLAPKVIVIGKAPSKDLDYYSGYNTIKQNSAGDITFVAEGSVVRVYVANFKYSYTIDDFYDDGSSNLTDAMYLGSFTPYAAE